MDYDRLPPAAVNRVIELVSQYNLLSVGAEEHGVAFWSGLCAIKNQRRQMPGYTPDDALILYASDRGVPKLPDNTESMIRASYEGMVPGALTVLPTWRVFFVEAVKEVGNLGIGVCSERHPDKPRCQILVTDKDFGEIPCAEREYIEGWWFYIEKALMYGLKP